MVCSSGINAERFSTRAAFVAKRASSASDGWPAASQKLAKLAVVADREDHASVARREVLVGDDRRMRIAQPLGRDAGHEVVQRLVREAGDLHVEQRDVDVLTDAGALAMRERRENRVARVQPAHDVGQRDADLHRSAAGLGVRQARYAHQSAETLNQEVVACSRRVGAGLAETRDRAVDEARVRRSEAWRSRARTSRGRRL